MGRQDDRGGADRLHEDSARLRDEGRRLRDISRELLAEIEALRRLEAESRVVPMGSAEFRQLSAQIAERSRGVFRLAAEQNDLAETVTPREETVEELDQSGEP